jgi:hypothetical protein
MVSVRIPEWSDQAIPPDTDSRAAVTAYAAIPDSSLNKLWGILPVLLGAALVASNPWFPFIDDECAIIDRAAQPVSKTLQLFLRGIGQHEHPPLYDLILHGWIRLTGGEMHLLRVPSILFYVLGTFALAGAAKYLGGKQSQMWVLLLVALWPYGFHFGRVAAWYSFSFFLVSLLTLGYFKYVEKRTWVSWVRFVVIALALVYANYFGWALLACLALDFVVRMRKSGQDWARPLLGTGILLLVSYLPILAAFLREIHHGVRLSAFGFGTALNGIFNLYCAFVSESVAPWFWVRGVLAGIAVALCLIVTFLKSPAPAKRFLVYFAGLLAAMTFLGIGETKRVMLISAWLILPIGVTLGALNARNARRVLLAALALVACIGWYGIFARDLYAAPRWVEPWEKLGREAAEVARSGGVVIGNNPSFFFYLTYFLPSESTQPKDGFHGLLPDSVHRSNVYAPEQWIAANHPIGRTTLLVKGLHYGTPDDSTNESEQWLDHRCNLLSAQRMVHDPGANWKQRYAPQTGQLAWRIEVRRYSCDRVEGDQE